MRYGLELPCGGTGLTLDLLIELGVRAEEAGWDGAFFEDYLVYYRGTDPETYDPWLLMAGIAVRTEHIRLGTTVTGLLARDIVKLVRDAVTLDHLCDGRVVLGVGLGDTGDRGAKFDRPVSDSTQRPGRRMDARLDLLLEMLSGDPVAPAAAAGSSDPVAFRPAGVQQPRLPVWVGGSSQAGGVTARAARADGIVPYKLTDTTGWSDFTGDEVAQLRHDVARHQAPGAGPIDIAIGGRERMADIGAERAAIREVQHGGATWWLEFVQPGTPDEMLAAVRRGPARAD